MDTGCRDRLRRERGAGCAWRGAVVARRNRPETGCNGSALASAPGGRVYNAADVNGVQSTEIVRRALIGGTHKRIEPLVFLRSDWRGRTASFLRYLSSLVDEGFAERAHVVGNGTAPFVANADFPVQMHDIDTETPETVLEAGLAADRPLVTMGNTVGDFMRGLEEYIDDRTIETEPPAMEWETKGGQRRVTLNTRSRRALLSRLAVGSAGILVGCGRLADDFSSSRTCN